MDSPAVDNQTEFEVYPQLVLDRLGERLLVVVKATFLLDGHAAQLPLAPAAFARPVRVADELWGEPGVESIRYPSDICCRKPGTDVIGVVTAWAPSGVPVAQFDTYIRVGPIAKAVRVFGLRVWESKGAGLSHARPIEQLDVRYDFAWGGRDLSDPSQPVEESRNPVGRGVVLDPNLLTHALGPQLEDPEQLMSSRATKPPPAGFGAIGRSYAPRRGFTGSYDEAWKNFRAPLPPEDEDDRFQAVASLGMTAVPPLIGGEECALLNLSPGGPLRFILPRVSLMCCFEVKGREPELIAPQLDTVLIDTWAVSEEKPPIVELVWRASVRAPRKMKDARVVVVERSPP